MAITISGAGITSAQLATDAIDGTHVADDAINSEHLVADSIDAEHLNANSVNTDAIIDSAIRTAHIQADNIVGSLIADDAVDSEHIAAGAVDDAHIVGLAASKLSGTIADARFPSTLPAASATNLTAIPAANITGTLPAIDGSNLTGIDLQSIRRDIATLALHSAIADNKAAYNLPSSFIDQFEDDTGLATQTNIDRNTTSEYVSSIIPAVGVNSNTKILLHMDDTSLTDSSGTSTTTTLTNIARSSAQSKFGGYSALSDGSDYITFANVPTWETKTTLFGIDFWWRPTILASLPSHQAFFNGVTDGRWLGFGWKASTGGLKIEVPSAVGGWQSPSGRDGTKTDFAINTWYHIAVAKTSATNIKWYVDGVQDGSVNIADADIACSGQPRLGEWGDNQTWYIDGYIDEYRVQIGENPTAVSTDPIYISSGTSFTPPTSAYSAESVNATGTLISTAQTANAAQTKVSGVILYKNNAGTATLGTDLKVYFTCNGGTNWTERYRNLNG